MALLTALMAAVMLAACGDSNNESGGSPSDPNPAEFVGVYKFEYASYEVLFVNGEVLNHQEKHVGDPSVTEDFVTLTLNADGTGIQKSEMSNQNITWTAEGNTITVTIPGQSIYWNYDNGGIEATMSVNISGNTMKEIFKLKKQ